MEIYLLDPAFFDADPAPSQVSPQEAFNPSKRTTDHLFQQAKVLTYGKVNKWAAYSILTDLYLNSKRSRE